MKTSLILVSAFLGVAYAGVVQLSPQEEVYALKMFQKLCSGYGAEGEYLEGTLVYCKRAPGGIQESVHHRVNVQNGGGQQSQIVFVQPPPVRYLHKVAIQGSGGQGQQTKVYVLPQKASHQISAEYREQPGHVQKPVVHFLKGDSSASSSTGYGPSQSQQTEYGVPAPSPQKQYGAPPKLEYGTPVKVGFT